MRPIQIRSAALIVTGLALGVTACHQRAPAGFTRDLTNVRCPGFNVMQRDIEVTPAGLPRTQIPAGHWIEFAAGAVPTTTTYRVTAGPGVVPDSLAQIRIDAIGGGMVTSFAGDVFLEINYAACAPLPGDLQVLMTDGVTGSKPLGGRLVNNRIRVLIPHLTLFSIAR